MQIKAAGGECKGKIEIPRSPLVQRSQLMRKTRLFLFPAILTLFIVTAGGYAAPKIICDQTIWDFETITEGEPAKHSFKIRNEGDAPLEIKRVRATCGCTAAKPAKNRLEPGGETTVEVNFNTSGRSGKQKKYVYVHSNDPEKEMLKLTITGEIKKKPAPRIAIRPGSWNLQSVKPDQVKRTTTAIMNTGEKPLEIKSITTTTGKLKAKILGPTTVPPGGRVNLEVSYTPDFKAEHIRDRVVIESNATQRPKSYFQLYGRVDMESVGFTLTVINVTRKGENTELDLYLNNKQTYPLKLRIPVAAPPNGTTLPPKANKRLKVTIPNKNLPDFSGVTDPKSRENLIQKAVMDLDLELKMTLPVGAGSSRPPVQSTSNRAPDVNPIKYELQKPKRIVPAPTAKTGKP